jgi:hypothetical protein
MQSTPADRAELCKFLGLPDDATDAEIQSAVQALITATGDTAAAPPPSAGAKGGNADVPPPPGVTFGRKLSRDELAYCEKHKLAPEQFAARKRDAVRSVGRK